MSVAKPQPGSINAPLGLGVQESGVNAFGSVQLLEVTGLSSDIPISTSLLNLATVYNGDIYIDDITFDTDSTGLATGTTFEVATDDPLGLAVFVSMAVSSLGANTSHSFQASTPWTVYVKRTIAPTYHIQIGSTSAACTGAGKWKMTIRYIPLVAGATLS